AQSERSSLLLGVPQIRAIEGVRVADHGRRSSNETPCVLRLTAAFRVSHSNPVQYIRNSPERIGRGVEILILCWPGGRSRTAAASRSSGTAALGHFNYGTWSR